MCDAGGRAPTEDFIHHTRRVVRSRVGGLIYVSATWAGYVRYALVDRVLPICRGCVLQVLDSEFRVKGVNRLGVVDTSV